MSSCECSYQPTQHTQIDSVLISHIHKIASHELRGQLLNHSLRKSPGGEW